MKQFLTKLKTKFVSAKECRLESNYNLANCIYFCF